MHGTNQISTELSGHSAPPAPISSGDPSVRGLVAGMVTLGVMAILGQAFTLWALLGFHEEKSYWEGQESKRSELAANLTALSERETAAREATNREEQERENAERNRREAQAAADLLKSERDQAESDKIEALASLSQAEIRNRALGDEERRLREAIESLREEEPPLRANVEELRTVRAALNETIDILSEQQRGLRQDTRELDADVKDARELRTTLSDEILALKQEAADSQRLIQQKVGLEETIGQLDQALELKRERLTELKAEVQDQADLSMDLAAQQAELLKLKKELRELSSQRQPLEEQVSRLLQDRERLSLEVLELRGESRELGFDMAGVVRKLTVELERLVTAVDRVVKNTPSNEDANSSPSPESGGQ